MGQWYKKCGREKSEWEGGQSAVRGKKKQEVSEDYIASEIKEHQFSVGIRAVINATNRKGVSSR